MLKLRCVSWFSLPFLAPLLISHAALAQTPLAPAVTPAVTPVVPAAPAAPAASPTTQNDWIVLTATGKNTLYNNVKIKAGDKFASGGTIEVGEGGTVKLAARGGLILQLGANSKAQLTAVSAKSGPSLLAGFSRWVFRKKSSAPATDAAASADGYKVRTSNAVMGIRGTDFYLSYNPLLGETEMICFDGKVNFASAKTQADERLVESRQWGGLGGRFGEKIAPILTLPNDALAHFSGLVSFPTQLPGGKANSQYHGQVVPDGL